MNKGWRWLRHAGLVLGTSAVLTLGAERDASAIVNVGAEGGIASHTDTNIGPAWGAHLELNPVLGLYIGAYYFHAAATWSSATDSTDNGILFDSFGGQLRYILSVPGLFESFKPYAKVGVGYATVQYPGVSVAPVSLTPGAVSTQFGSVDPRSGHYIEVPIGVGFLWQFAKVVQLDLGLAYRPGFSFSGDAYNPPSGAAYTQPTSGFSGTIGLSLDF
jgi:hypothetical protein